LDSQLRFNHILEVFGSWTRSIDKKNVYFKVHDESFLKYDKVQASKTMSIYARY